MSWRELAPGPGRFWIRFAPKRWPPSETPYLDFVDRRIAWPEEAAPTQFPPPPGGRADLAYVPPVPGARRAERERWVLDFERAGGGALVHGAIDEAEEPTATGARWVDLLSSLLGGADPSVAAALPVELSVAAPLLPGVFADPSQWQPWLRALAVAGRRTVVGVPVELTPADRRRLAELAGEERWERIFHSDPASDREFARAASAAGLSPFPARPALALPPRRARNRELATALAEAGELWLRLARPESEGQSLLAAARHVEATPLDLAALAREGNLGVIGWLSPLARAVVEKLVAHERAPLVDELRAELLAVEPVAS
jgi:hypothetical protein